MMAVAGGHPHGLLRPRGPARHCAGDSGRTKCRCMPPCGVEWIVTRPGSAPGAGDGGLRGHPGGLSLRQWAERREHGERRRPRPRRGVRRPATFLSIRPGWLSMANTPFWRRRTWIQEGGISTPLIDRRSRGIPGLGELRRTPSRVLDLVSTSLEAAGSRAKPNPRVLRRRRPLARHPWVPA